MKMNCFAGTTTILLLVMAGAGAQQKAPTPPPMAAKLIAQWGKQVQADYCDGTNFRASGEAKVAFAADLNNDKVVDYVLSPEQFECYVDGERAYSIYGPLMPWAVVASLPAGRYGLVEFQNSEAHEPEIRMVDGAPALILSHRAGGSHVPPFETFAFGPSAGTARWGTRAWFDGKGKRVNENGSPYGVAKTSALPPLGLVAGHYAHPKECRNAHSYFMYDGKRAGIVMQDMLDVVPVAALRKRGNWWSEEESAWAVSVTGTTRIVLAIQDEVPASLCPPEQVPAWAKRSR